MAASQITIYQDMSFGLLCHWPIRWAPVEILKILAQVSAASLVTRNTQQNGRRNRPKTRLLGGVGGEVLKHAMFLLALEEKYDCKQELCAETRRIR